MPDQIITDALERFSASQAGSDYNRKDALADVEFARLGKQWPDAIRKQREQEGRPCLVINRLPSFIRQVVNDGRMNNPGIAVHPVDSGADPDTAQVISGLVRSIERASKASVAYDTALDHSASSGFGFFRVTTDHCHPDSFDLEARIERVANQFTVHWDTNTTAFDASDWEYAFVSDMLTEKEFKRKYPKAEPISFEAGSGEDLQWWIEDEKIRVAEYFLRDEKKRKLLGFQDGSAFNEDQLAAYAKKAIMGLGMEPPKAKSDLVKAAIEFLGEPTRERESTYYVVKRRVMNAFEVLEETDWPGQLIPICPVWGEEVIFEGRRWLRSLIRDARDPQAMFNFWRSATTELVALAPRAPWVGPEGFVPKGKEEDWRTANTRSHAYLEYARTSPAPPQRLPFAGIPAGALQEAMNASDDMKSIMGIFDASLGARSNETSGKAIMARQREGDVSTFHFIDNLNRAIEYCGKVLVEIIPSVYGQRQAIQILGDDMSEKVIKLGERNPDGRLYDLNVGKYDVTIKTGPSFTTQREEMVTVLTEIMRNVPDSAPVLGDVLIQNMDFPNADKVAKRLKALLPPQIQAIEAEETIEGLPPEAQDFAKQAMSQIQTLQGELEKEKASKQDPQKTQLEAQKVQVDAQIKAKELQLKERELGLKERQQAFDEQKFAAEIQLRAQEDMTRRMQPNPQPQ
jgi:hypothetical protein